MQKSEIPDNSDKRLIAHRGFSARYPENTLLAMEKAFDCGAGYVECDIQLTRDEVPVLLHDSNLLRCAGMDTDIFDLNYQALDELAASYLGKFAGKFAQENIPSLVSFVELLKSWEGRTAFIEIKRASIQRFGADVVLKQVLSLLSAVRNQVILISFDDEIIRRLKNENQWKIGWVVEQWDKVTMQILHEISPDYFFVDHECLPAGLTHFEPATWKWVVYEVDDPVQAQEYIQMGADFVETNDICNMLQANLENGTTRSQ